MVRQGNVETVEMKGGAVKPVIQVHCLTVRRTTLWELKPGLARSNSVGNLRSLRSTGNVYGQAVLPRL